jgi:hypothetical protein
MSDHIKDYFSGMKDVATLQELTSMDYSLYEFPRRFPNSLDLGTYHTYFWTALLAAVIMAGVIFLGRKAFHARAPRVTAA